LDHGYILLDRMDYIRAVYLSKAYTGQITLTDLGEESSMYTQHSSMGFEMPNSFIIIFTASICGIFSISATVVLFLQAHHALKAHLEVAHMTRLVPGSTILFGIGDAVLHLPVRDTVFFGVFAYSGDFRPGSVVNQ
jgi:hypothetical protein